MSSRQSQNSYGPKGEAPFGPVRAPIVVLHDGNAARREVINEVITSCGGKAVVVEKVSELEDLECVGGLAVVALGRNSLPDELSLSVIQALKARQFSIISYEDNVFSWPIGLRCRALLNGTLLLLDSAAITFIANLQTAFTRVLQTKNERHIEELQIKEQITRLGVVGASAQMLAVFRSVIRFAALSDFPVLISGETGTGKEVIASSLYRLDGKRSKGPFVIANCSAINSGLAESELFGHRRGSFTGADADRKGLFRSAEGGVLFLDEIGELSQSIQAKLLRVLQEGRVLPVGYDREVAIDVRVIAATNKNLSLMVRDGSFREDLYHRLSVLTIHVPPLRERREDLQPLIDHFLKKYSSLNQCSTGAVSADFLEALRRMKLSGNVRQLENIVRRALLNAAGKTSLSLNDLTTAELEQLADGNLGRNTVSGVVANAQDPLMPPSNSQAGFSRILDLNDWNLSKSLDYCERALLECGLRLTHGNQSQTARLMGITPRSVYNKLQKHKLRYP
jgi:two-component system NtrC family response regulator